MTLIPPDPIGGFPGGDPVGPLPGEAAPAPLPGDVDSIPLPGDMAPAALPGAEAIEAPPSDAAPVEPPVDIAPIELLETPGDPPSSAGPRTESAVTPSAEAPPRQPPAPPTPPPTTAPSGGPPPGPPPPGWHPGPGWQPPPGAPPPGGPLPPGQSPEPSAGGSSRKSSSKLAGGVMVAVLLFVVGPSLSQILDGFGEDSGPSDPPPPAAESTEEELDAETFYPMRADVEETSFWREDVWDNVDCAAAGVSPRDTGCGYGIEAQYATGEDDLWYRQHVLVFDSPEEAADMATDVSAAQVTSEVEFRGDPVDASDFTLTEGAIDAVGDQVVITATDVGPGNSGDVDEQAETLQLFHDQVLAILE